MTTSGVSDYTITAGDLINEVLQDLGVLALGETAASEYTEASLRALNDLLKQYMGGPSPLLPSAKRWKREFLLIPLAAKAEYLIGLRRLAFTSGGTTEIVPGNTITGATSASTANVLAVITTSGTWAGGDAAGYFIIDTNAAAFVSENLGVGTSLNLATIAGNSTQYGPPLDILGAMYRESDGTDAPMEPMTLQEYLAIGDKDASGTPTRYYFEKQIDRFRLFLDYQPSDITEDILLAVMLPLEDLDALTDHIDVPREWFRAIKWSLAKELYPKFPSSKDRQQMVMGLATEAMAIANTAEPDDVVHYFQPGLDE